MPSTLTSLHYHVTFSTKNRLPLIRKDWRNDLHGYIGGIIKGLNGFPLAIGGINDHIHLLFGLKSSHRLDYFLRDVKADSSAWIHNKLKKKFAWQKGYAAFTVSPNSVEGVRKYVLNQEKHHQRKDFKKELIEMLDESGLEYNEEYLW